MSYQTAVELKAVQKLVGDERQIDLLNLDIKKGEFVALLGRPDSGKGQVLRTIAGLSTQTQGEIYVMGLNARYQMSEIKTRLGVVLSDDGLDCDFSVMENLLVFADYLGFDGPQSLQRIRELLKQFQIDHIADKNITELNLGQKRRVALARALIADPDVLVLDDLTEQLQVSDRHWLWDFLRTLKDERRTVLLGTQFAQEAEKICDRVIFMDNGHVVKSGVPQEIIRSEIGNEVVDFRTLSRDLAYYLTRLKSAGYDYEVYNHTTSVFIREGKNSAEAMAIVAGNHMTLRRPHLGDVYLKLTGRTLRDLE